MKKGKTLPLSLIKKICAAILIKHSYSQITNFYQVGKSTIQRCKQCLEKANISALNDFFKLEEDQLAKIIYGDKGAQNLWNNTYFLQFFFKKKVNKITLLFFQT